MCGKIFSVVIIIIALVLAILATAWPQDRIADIIYISRFFDVMIPILAVGALVKYLCCCGKNKCKSCCKSACENKK